jgi:hypothetical protein
MKGEGGAKSPMPAFDEASGVQYWQGIAETESIEHFFCYSDSFHSDWFLVRISTMDLLRIGLLVVLTVVPLSVAAQHRSETSMLSPVLDRVSFHLMPLSMASALTVNPSIVEQSTLLMAH